ncbi:MAG: hypothetical protein QM608_02820 [Caulobacter sp.]
MEKTTRIWFIRLLVAVLVVSAAVGIAARMGWVRFEIESVSYWP